MFLFFLCIFASMKVWKWFIFLIVLVLIACHKTDVHKTVICIPVYGQSLALGVDAQRITDFDSLAIFAEGRIVTENLDHHYGYFDLSATKQFVKKLTRHHNHSNELSVYTMAEMIASHTGRDTLICIFPGGQDGTVIADLGKGTPPYQKFIRDIKTAYKTAQRKGWDFVVPAICWMQGETDINSYPGTNYRELLVQFTRDISNDVKQITGQKKNVEIICYQSNSLTRAEHFNSNAYHCVETEVPQTQMELVRDNPIFHASGPTYPYDCVNNIIHIDGIGQKKQGALEALAAIDILRHQRQPRGLLPLEANYKDQEIIILFQVPNPPLTFDTIQVTNPGHYGFSVITPDNRNIIDKVSLKDNSIIIKCSEKPSGCSVRYAVNGEKMKSGRQHGPRGNLRDSQGKRISIKYQGTNYPVHNWCYQFDIPVKYSF